MHNQAHKPRQPFLDKFQGKKNAIGKEGLLHLLEIQRQSHEQRHQVSSHRGPKVLNPIAHRDQIRETPPRTQPHSQKGNNSRIRGSSERVNKNSALYGEYIQDRYRLKEPQSQFKSQQLVSKIRLPAINKSSSLSHHGRKQHTDIVNGQVTGTTGISGHNKIKLPSKRLQSHQSLVLNSVSKKMELDTYALRHLEFMEKFEKQLINNENVAKRTVRSEMNRPV